MYLCRHQLTNLQVGFLVSWLQLRVRHLVLTHDPVLVVPGHFSHRLKYTLNTDMWTQYHLLWHIYLATLTLTPLEIHSTLAHSPLVRPLWFVRYFISSNSPVCDMSAICKISWHDKLLRNLCDLWYISAHSSLVRYFGLLILVKCLWFVRSLSTFTPCYTAVICAISQHTHPLWSICDLWDISAHSPLVRRLWFAALGWVLPLWSWQLNTPTQGEVSPGQSSCGQGRFVREGARDPPPPQLCPSGSQPHPGSVHT